MRFLKRTVSWFLALILLGGILTVPLGAAGASDKTFKEVSFSVKQYCRGKTSYNNLYDTSSFSYMDGLYLQTSSSYFKIEYAARDRTHDWNDWVWSTSKSDYAGWYKYNVTNVKLRVYDIANGCYDSNNYVVMYRAKSGSTWCSWVSNAPDYTMNVIKNEFALSGEIDASATDAGDRRYGDITALQIHIYVRNSHAPGSSAKVIDVPYYNQNKIGLINGCESVSAVMALNKAGYSITPDAFVSRYLDMGATKTDPNENYVGDPYTSSGWGCYNTVIKKDIDKAINKNNNITTLLNGKSLEFLTTTYIDNGIPVIIWATVFMTNYYKYTSWTAPNGKYITYNNRLHCLLLVGYDNDYYYFNDPLCNVEGNKVTGYKKSLVSAAYTELGKQAVVITEHYGSSLNVESLPTKSVYFVGEEIDRDGLKVEVKDSSGKVKEIKDYALNYTKNIAGKTTVTVSYINELDEKLMASFEVTYINESDTVTGLVLDTEACKVETEMGLPFDFSGLKVYEQHSVK